MIERTEDGHEIEQDGFYTLHCTGHQAQQAADVETVKRVAARQNTTDPRA